MTYLLGWSVIPQILIRRERWPGRYRKSVALVSPGQEVQPDQPIIRLERIESIEEMATIPVPRLSLPTVRGASAPPEYRSVDGDTPAQNQPASETIPAGLRGRVVEITRRGGVIIETRAAVVQGAIGAGKQVAGVLTLWQPSDPRHGQQAIPPGALLIVPGPVNFAMLRQAMISGVAGVIASSISSRDMEGFLQADLVQLINSASVELAQTRLPQMTLLLTEGLGTIAMPVGTINLLSQYQGLIALLAGATSVRQKIFPELDISLPEREAQQDWHPVEPDPTIMIGAQVRVCSGNYEGVIGEVDYLFGHQQVFYSGIRARAVRLRLEDGSMLVVPLVVIERVG